LEAAVQAVGSKSDPASRLTLLQGRQSELVARLDRVTVTPAVEAARQQARLHELAADADRLAEAIRDAGVPADPESPAARALAGALQARDDLTQAARDTAGRRPAAAAKARARATDFLAGATTALSNAVGSTPPAPPRGEWEAVGPNLRKAAAAMRRSERLLGAPNGIGDAAASMRAATEAVSGAANGLTASMTKTGRGPKGAE
jgi:hypothetical protein